MDSVVKRFLTAIAAARRLRARRRALYTMGHEYLAARLDTFPYLDAGYYDEATRRAQDLGFRALGDVEDVTVSRLTSGMPTLLRALSDGAGNSLVVYHLKRVDDRSVARDSRVLSVTTEFSDGTFSATSNAWSARHIKRPASSRVDSHPYGTDLYTLVEAHRNNVAAYRAKHPNAIPVVVNTIGDWIESMKRGERLKAEFQRKKGYEVSREELQSIAADSGKASMHKTADAVADAGELLERGRIVVRILGWIALVILFGVVVRLFQLLMQT